MDITALTEEIELIAGAGDAGDALDLVKRLLRTEQVEWAIEIRRSVRKGELDHEKLIASGETLRQRVIQHREQARRDLMAATRALLRGGGDDVITRGALALAPFI
ncbi:hypothetical protein HEP81_04646 [Streptomyces griseofuscus]|uniref:Uncharacterized protein n=1 Tax=Streptomyces griseofuscus TaxID=146922 RepID=A0A7H1Q3N9_9ACTN|nr:hypothetical protein [Streptomyces griseofuscus]QNT94919.1 hypothetical protein HEP81_04646 [Streptomyces griseofuscus]